MENNKNGATKNPQKATQKRFERELNGKKTKKRWDFVCGGQWGDPRGEVCQCQRIGYRSFFTEHPR